jgi:shikimate kinase
MNIVLTGMRGSGKSYQGKRLAKTLGWKFVDTDDLIEKKAGSTISAIVKQHGWPHFRKLEHEICEEVSDLDEHVISTGGGLIIDRKNEQLLRENGQIVLLYRTPDNCAERILKGHKERPALTNRNIENPDDLKAELTEIWNEREKRYRQSSDLIIDVNQEIEPEEILEKLQDI